MVEVPAEVTTVSSEGRDIVTALAQAAEELGLESKRVAYKIDLDHFRNATGGSRCRDSVRIIAWPRPEGEEAPEETRAAPSEDDSDADTDIQEEAAPVEEAKPLPSSPASDKACAWVLTLLGHMGIEATVQGGADDERVQLVIRADQPGRVVGKRGTTLSAIRHIVRLLLKEDGDPIIDVDVDKTGVPVDLSGRGRERRGRDRKDSGRRGDRDRDRGRGRGGRSRDRDRDRDRDSDRNKGRVAPEKLKALAQRAAEKAIESGKTITINLELNSYDRRLVHMTIADIDGIESRSEEKEGMKFIQIVPE
jgi:predicted RNA-binding protein Jag